MKKPGRGTNGHIAIGCNNVDRAIYHLSQRGVKFDLDSKNVKNGKTVPATWQTRSPALPSIWCRHKRLSPFSRKSPAAAGMPCGGMMKHLIKGE